MKTNNKRKITNGICIVGEPTEMKIIDSHKACYEYTTFFEGLAGHSSKPDEGVNAAEYASKYVNKLMSLRNDPIAQQVAKHGYGSAELTKWMNSTVGRQARMDLFNAGGTRWQQILKNNDFWLLVDPVLTNDQLRMT